MEAKRKRNIQSGAQYDHLFVKATLKDFTVKKGATVADTVKFIPKVVQMKRWQTQSYTDTELKGLPVYDACKKLWQFLYNHVAYKKDEAGLEQIRSPARLWHDRFRGVDCDCYTTFISTVLTNLGIPHKLRIAKYSEDYFQHIYPVVPMPDGSYITIDCVVNEFNYEEPYTEIKDTTMDLQLLDGIDEPEQLADVKEEVYGIEEDELGQLGWSLKKTFKKVAGKVSKGVSQGAKFVGKKVIAAGAKTVAKAAVKAGKFTVDKVKKVAHVLNRLNPLRLGFLAAMKLNSFNVARNLRMSYLNKDQAVQRNLNPGKHNSLIKIRKKLESLFYAAGGNSSDLKAAILKGRGNQGKDKVLAGLDGVEDTDFDALNGMDENTSLYQVLGPELFASNAIVTEEDLQGIRELELDGVEGLEGLDGTSIADQYYVGQELVGLGEPATLSIAAASGALATIAGLIKNLGNLYDKGKAVADNIKPITAVAKAIIPASTSNSRPAPQAPAVEEDAAPAMVSPAPSADPSPAAETPPAPETDETDETPEVSASKAPVIKPPAKPTPTSTAVVVSPATTNQVMTQQTTQPANTSNAPGFWDKHKKWLKPTLIGVGGFGLLYLGYRLFAGNKAKSPSPPASKGLSGLKGKKKKKANGKKREPIALM